MIEQGTRRVDAPSPVQAMSISSKAYDSHSSYGIYAGIKRGRLFDCLTVDVDGVRSIATVKPAAKFTCSQPKLSLPPNR